MSERSNWFPPNATSRNRFKLQCIQFCCCSHHSAPQDYCHRSCTGWGRKNTKALNRYLKKLFHSIITIRLSSERFFVKAIKSDFWIIGFYQIIELYQISGLYQIVKFYWIDFIITPFLSWLSILWNDQKMSDRELWMAHIHNTRLLTVGHWAAAQYGSTKIWEHK